MYRVKQITNTDLDTYPIVKPFEGAPNCAFINLIDKPAVKLGYYISTPGTAGSVIYIQPILANSYLRKLDYVRTITIGNTGVYEIGMDEFEENDEKKIAKIQIARIFIPLSSRDTEFYLEYYYED